MKCFKCNKEIDDNSKFCTYCGITISKDKKILYNTIKIILYIITSIFIILTLYAWLSDKIFIEGLLFLISAIFTLPITYNLITRYLKFLNKPYIRVVLIVAFFFIAIYISPSSQNVGNDNTDVNKQQEAKVENKVENKEEKTENKEIEKKVENKDKADNIDKQNAIKSINNNDIQNQKELDNSIDNEMVGQFMNLGFNIEEATEMQHLFYQMGIKSIKDIHSGSTNPDINKLVAFVATANNNEKQKFYFSIENRKMFYAGFTSEDLYDSAKGGVLKNINDVHIPETKVSIDDYSRLQVLAQDEVKKYLNYPSTASFPLYDGWGVGRSDDKYKIIGKVNAKNGFGVKSQISFSVWFIKKDNNFVVDAVVIDGNRFK